MAVSTGALFFACLPHLVVFLGSTLDSAPTPGVSFRPSAPLDPQQRELANAIIGDRNALFLSGRQIGDLMGPHPLVKVFDEVCARPDATAILEDVLARGDTNAQLYAMALLHDLDGGAYARWAPTVAAKNAEIMVSDGCTHLTRPPGDVLRMIERGLSFAPPAD